MLTRRSSVAEHTYTIPDGPKMLRETLCTAQALMSNMWNDAYADRWQIHIDQLQRLIDECDRKRPLGPDGKHDERHTDECGCDDTV